MTRSVEKVDVLVSGGGPAGLAVALGLAAEGLETVCVDAKPLDASADGPRTTALLTPSIAYLDRIGVWPGLSPKTTPLRVMRLLDVAADGEVIRKSAPFRAEDLDKDAFGSNVANSDLRAALLAAASAQPRIDVRAPARTAHLTRRDDAAFATLDDGVRLRADLVVAADGRESAVRAGAGLRVRRWRYRQSALVCLVSHPKPHDGVSTEIHRVGGPFTLVPHTDGPDGRPRSGIVWMMDHDEAARRSTLTVDAFAEEATAWSMGALGPLTLASERSRWPIQSMLADRFAARRLALAGEAAHVVPPIGAQGLNMSLADAAALVDMARDARARGRDIADERALNRYARARRADAAARVLGTAALNVAAIGAIRPIRDARRLGLSALFDAPPARRFAMRIGLGG